MDQPLLAVGYYIAMSNRVVPFLGMIAMWFVIAITGAITLTVGYWISDVLYDAGLWPLGALLRIALLLEILGLGITLLALPFAAVWVLLFGSGD